MRKTTFIALVLLAFGIVGVAESRKTTDVVWVDFDSRSIPEPKDRGVGYYDSFFNSEFAERWKRATDIPRFVRQAVGAPKKAPNVNALDEVPDSSWYTNRHALRPMTLEQLLRGPNTGSLPDLSRVTITRAKLEGVTPGLQLTDKGGESYLIKFDNKDYPELQSGAEVISTRILYAAGYNVPENYIAIFDPRNVEIKEGTEFGSGKSKHPFTQEDLEKMLKNAARRPDGTYRVLASRILKGKTKGPFAYIGLRADDPNDLIPHEHRRELRGLRVIASWINHWDMKELNTLDMYVEENGRKFIRHFLIDFGSSLGGGKSPLEYFHGREYAFDSRNMMKELFSLGLYRSPAEKSMPLIYPEVGIFTAEDFDPGDWRPSFHMMAFDNMTREDALWGTRIILSFTEDELLAIVKTAQFTNPKATDYVFRTLLDRRRLVAEQWFKDANPIGNFAVESASGAAALRFDDFMTAHDLAGPAQYRYEISDGNGERGERKTVSMPRIPLGSLNGTARIRIWTVREDAAKPVTVHLQSRPGGAYGIVRIERS